MTKTTLGQTALLSYCEYADGLFQFFIEDKETGEKICISGKQDNLSPKAYEVLSKLFAACVTTEYMEIIYDRTNPT